MDIVARMEHLPRPVETVFENEQYYIPEGNGSNQSVAASLSIQHLGVSTSFSPNSQRKLVQFKVGQNPLNGRECIGKPR